MSLGEEWVTIASSGFPFSPQRSPSHTSAVQGRHGVTGVLALQVLEDFYSDFQIMVRAALLESRYKEQARIGKS